MYFKNRRLTVNQSNQPVSAGTKQRYFFVIYLEP